MIIRYLTDIVSKGGNMLFKFRKLIDNLLLGI